MEALGILVMIGAALAALNEMVPLSSSPEPCDTLLCRSPTCDLLHPMLFLRGLGIGFSF